MNAIRIVGIVLIVAGIAALSLGSFSFTKETHQAKLGPIELSVKEKQTVNFPAWAGVAAIVGHIRPLFLGFKKGGKGVATAPSSTRPQVRTLPIPLRPTSMGMASGIPATGITSEEKMVEW